MMPRFRRQIQQIAAIKIDAIEIVEIGITGLPIGAKEKQLLIVAVHMQYAQYGQSPLVNCCCSSPLCRSYRYKCPQLSRSEYHRN